MTEQSFRMGVLTLLALNTLGLGALLWRGAPATLSVTTSSSTPSALAGPRVASSGGEPVAVFLRSTMAPVRRAARDRGEDPARYLPTDAQLRAATQSADLGSTESQVVLGRLRDAYAHFGMPFPETGAPRAMEQAGDPGDQAAIVGAWLRTTTDRLRRAAEAAGEDPSTYTPTSEELAAARAEGDLQGDAARPVLTRLRAGYEHFGLAFPDPVQGGLAP